MKKTVTLYLFTIVIAIPAGIIHLITLLFGFWSHIWFPFVGCTGIQIILAALFISDFYEEFRYFCPNCECFFKAWDIKEYIFSKHGILERELTCPRCKEKHWCDEIHKGDI